jgi:MSHA pilin protein MshD
MRVISRAHRCQFGLTLIELIIFIVIVSVGLVGIVGVLNITVWHSADPLLQKQAQTLAEGLLEEIQTGYFAYCDGADAKLKYATSAAACTAGIGDSYGPEAGETRPNDTVKDYASGANTATSLASVLPAESSIVAPSGYSASVTLIPTALDTAVPAASNAVSSADSMLIRVTVTGPGSTQAVAEGFKTRQVPQ